MPRHGSESKMENTEELYEEFFEERGVNKITHYKTAVWPPLTSEVRSRFSTIRHRWKTGDKYWKLANTHYGDSKLWWTIAWYNEKPTEAHLKVGDLVLIPIPVDQVVSFFNYGSV
jgi:nucleoid-associated protein YgaU|tara:strand:+ start:1870 stop:2214 length:345 start_codon:yes stop_codon:yes gene_type:complete